MSLSLYIFTFYIFFFTIIGPTLELTVVICGPQYNTPPIVTPWDFGNKLEQKGVKCCESCPSSVKKATLQTFTGVKVQLKAATPLHLHYGTLRNRFSNLYFRVAAGERHVVSDRRCKSGSGAERVLIIKWTIFQQKLSASVTADMRIYWTSEEKVSKPLHISHQRPFVGFYGEHAAGLQSV